MLASDFCDKHSEMYSCSTLITPGEDQHVQPHQFGVDLGVKPGVTNEVDDPPLRFLRRHVELVCQHAEKRVKKEGHLFNEISICVNQPLNLVLHLNTVRWLHVLNSE